MSYKDICQAWVDNRKFEDNDGMFWILDWCGLWRRATDGEAIEQFVV